MSYLRSEPVQKGRQILVNYSVTVMPDSDPASPSADGAISSEGDPVSPLRSVQGDVLVGLISSIPSSLASDTA